VEAESGVCLSSMVSLNGRLRCVMLPPLFEAEGEDAYARQRREDQTWDPLFPMTNFLA
jgi:hypothetical protein